MNAGLTNWAGNLRFSASAVHRPTSIDELRRLIAASKRARALGAGHSFSPIADTRGDLISLERMPKIIEVDSVRGRVKVSADVSYTELAPKLDARGFALANLASLPHISVAGACATATHGSGNTVGNLATAVSALELVTAQGEIVTMSRTTDGDQFAGAVVGLGSLGVITSLTLDLIPTFELRQYVGEAVPFDHAAAHLGGIFASGYSVSVFTNWRDPLTTQIWLKTLADQQDRALAAVGRLGGRLADGPRHPVPGLPPTGTTAQLGAPGPWHERLPHFTPGSTPSTGDELQSEYLMPREKAGESLLALAAISDVLAPLVQVCEVRTVASDDLWLSPSYGRDTVAVHFTWIADARAVMDVLEVVERTLAPFEPRPHWGKIFVTPPEQLRARYERIGDFVGLMRRLDPAAKFSNDFTAKYLAAYSPSS